MIVFEKPMKKPPPSGGDEEDLPDGAPALQSYPSLEPEVDPSNASISSRPSSLKVPAPSSLPTVDRSSVTSVDSVSDPMFLQAKKAARRASLKKTIAELTLLKAGALSR